jgi:glycerol-3-phosphate O-acyltransferase/dihydroxyacetone phosphate acyltransferase
MAAQRFMILWIYDLIASVLHICCSIFFREIYAPGAGQTPRQGPVIIVAAPHHNQFVDTALLIRILKQYTGRRISFLIADKSYREPVIGLFAACVRSLPVVRSMDIAIDGPGKLQLMPGHDETFIHGQGVNFTDSKLFMVGSVITICNPISALPEQRTIVEILGPSLLRIREPFSKSSLSVKGLEDASATGLAYKVAPHIDQRRMFEAVQEELQTGGCIGIFPEGGSHDRPSLLPLKPGVALIALGALAQSPDLGLTIIPCGMNYFSPNKFRSRAVIEFGPPIQVDTAQVEAFRAGGELKRNAVGSLLYTIQTALDSVSQQAPDRDIFTLIQATRRLYRPIRMKIPLTMVVELNRRLLKGYTKFKGEPQVQHLIKSLKAYERRLAAIGIKDHQVEGTETDQRPLISIFGTLLYRVGELIIMSMGALPSLLLFWPIFLTARVISHRKQREALAKSSVKLDGRDVVGSWKILVALVFTPVLYLWYTTLLTVWLSCSRGICLAPLSIPPCLDLSRLVPDVIPLPLFSLMSLVSMVVLSFAGLRTGEIGVDILRSLPPLVMVLGPASSTELRSLRSQRRALTASVVEVIDTFGPEIYAFFEDEKLRLSQQELLERRGSVYHDLHGGYATYTSELKCTPAQEWTETSGVGDAGITTGVRNVRTSSVCEVPGEQMPQIHGHRIKRKPHQHTA